MRVADQAILVDQAGALLERAAVNIQDSLIAAMHDIAKTGIAKLSRADLGGTKVNYRGIEAAMNEMCVVLIRNKISVTPTYSDLNIIERAKTENGQPTGKATRFVTVKGCFTFAAEDGSSVNCTTYGEAMDSGDKATIKAQSVAFRTALFQQFIIPTMAMDPEEGDPEALPEEALTAAEQGMTSYEAFYKALSKDGRIALAMHHEELKAIAAGVDKAKS